MSKTETLRTFERKLLHHCAPTLAGIKPGSLFNCCVHTCDKQRANTVAPTALPLEDLSDIITRCQAKLACFGVKLDVLASSATGVLIYVWRPSALQTILNHKDVSVFIAQAGYCTTHAPSCVEILSKRIRISRSDSQPCVCMFPHEIGIFLGYPLEDVVGFIENKGKNYLCCGYWKAYTHAARAQATFTHWRRCTTESLALFDSGAFIEDVVTALQDYPMLNTLDCAS